MFSFRSHLGFDQLLFLFTRKGSTFWARCSPCVLLHILSLGEAQVGMVPGKESLCLIRQWASQKGLERSHDYVQKLKMHKASHVPARSLQSSGGSRWLASRQSVFVVIDTRTGSLGNTAERWWIIAAGGGGEGGGFPGGSHRGLQGTE